MLRNLFLIAAALLLASCGEMAALVSQTKTVAAPREEVFKKMFGTDGANFRDIPLVTNGGSTRLYELVAKKGDPRFRGARPHGAPRRAKDQIRRRDGNPARDAYHLQRR